MNRKKLKVFLPLSPFILLILLGEQNVLSIRGGGGKSVTAAPFSVRNMLSHYAYNVIYPHYRDFAQNVQSLDLKIDNYCENLDGEQEDIQRRQQAKQAFQAAMLDFHRLQAFQIGPILTSQISLEIYSPSSMYGYCPIDHQVVKRELGRQNGTKGLAALEYLLFDRHVAYKCHVTIDSLANWQDKELLARKKDRCHYMQLITENLVSLSSGLEDAWNPDKGNWGEYLVTGTSSRKSTALIFDSLFYLEIEVKDKKLLSLIRHARGQELDREHEHSNLHLLGIAANLQGFLSMFVGKGEEGSLGLADLLSAMGHARLALTVIDTSSNLIDKLKERTTKGHLMENAQSDEDFYNEVHEGVRSLTNILKLQLPSIFNLEPPAQAKGDSD